MGLFSPYSYWLSFTNFLFSIFFLYAHRVYKSVMFFLLCCSGFAISVSTASEEREGTPCGVQSLQDLSQSLTPTQDFLSRLLKDNGQVM